jgi:hypothetical protein
VDVFQSGESGQGGQTGQGGQGGAAGEIRFRYKDAMSIEPRDDALPLTELNRLLAVHKDLHKAYVDKQKLTRKERKILKEGRASLTSRQDIGLGRGGSGGGHSNYKKHPISDKAQFSGVDRQISALPTKNQADTNEQQRADLENRLELRHQNVPKFNPKPRPY